MKHRSRWITLLMFLMVFAACQSPSSQTEDSAGKHFETTFGSGEEKSSLTGHQDSSELINNRVYRAIQEKQYQEAINELDILLKTPSTDLTKLMLRCLLGERTGESEKAVTECYQCVADGFREQNAIDPLAEFNFVVALLLAKDPNAQAEADRVMRKHQGTDLEETAFLLLKDFDRDAYIHSILP